ncbi:MAG: xanthine dehydrogenase subunit D [Kyrpidia sp.]|nr:xanthine dehydrogenase subunit D [Kyrpidia sp.]
MKLDRESAGARWIVRPDGCDKVTGKLNFLTDLSFPGMVYGTILRSPYPHARIKAIRTDAAARLPGVVAVITHRDVPGVNRFGIMYPDQPVLCEDRVRFVGDAVAAVAAESEEAAGEALRLIEVEYEELPVIDSPEAALAPEAPRLHPGGNVLHRTHYERGNVEGAFRRCAVIVEETYETPRQMHAYMETEGGLFVPGPDGKLAVYAPTQHGYMDRMQLARILAMPETDIRVVSSPIGGSFGGKDELNIQPYGALLALCCGRPVKIHQSRWESVRAGLKRHPMKIAMKTGVDADGRLLAHRVRILADTGAYATLGAPVLQFATEHAVGPYRIPHVDVEGWAVYTNNGVSGEFRGFGGNQVVFALEGQMDRLAEALGMDAWEFRRINLRGMDDPGPLGQRVAPTDGARHVWETIRRSSLWERRSGRTTDRRAETRLHQRDVSSGSGHVDVRPDNGGSGPAAASFSSPWVRRGVGAAMVMHGCGLGFGIPDPAGGRIGLSAQGNIQVAFGHEEFGQGLLASLQLMIQDLFACDPGDIEIILGDTDRAPHSGSSTASRTTSMVWQALHRLQPHFSRAVCERASTMSGIPVSHLRLGPGGVWAGPERVVRYREIAEKGTEGLQFETQFHFPVTPDAIMGGHYLYTFAGVVTEVEVNLLTGQVTVLGVEHAVAAGPVVNPMGYLGQIEGGNGMALGFALMEDAVMDGSRYVTTNLDTYLIPTIRDVPERIEVYAIEDLPPNDNYGPRGVGEVGSVGLAPAIAAAVRQATGTWINRLPISREQLMRPISTFLHENAPMVSVPDVGKEEG